MKKDPKDFLRKGEAFPHIRRQSRIKLNYLNCLGGGGG